MALGRTCTVSISYYRHCATEKPYSVACGVSIQIRYINKFRNKPFFNSVRTLFYLDCPSTNCYSITDRDVIKPYLDVSALASFVVCRVGVHGHIRHQADAHNYVILTKLFSSYLSGVVWTLTEYICFGCTAYRIVSGELYSRNEWWLNRIQR